VRELVGAMSGTVTAAPSSMGGASIVVRLPRIAG